MKAMWKKLTAIGIIIVILLVLPVTINIRSDIMNLAVLLFIYIILSQSWNLIGGYTGQINLGLAALFGGGVMTTHILWQAGVPIVLAVMAGGVSALVLALIIGLPALRLKGVYFAIGTLAFAQVCTIIVANTFTSIVVMPASFTRAYTLISRYYLSLIVAILATVLVYLIVNSRLGLAMLAVRDDEEAARVTGVNTFKYKVIALLISSFLGGLGGGVYAFYTLSFSGYSQVFNPLWTFQPLMAVMIGGAGTLFGPVVGSFFLVVLSQIFTLTLGDAHLILFGILFILVVLYFPFGLVGSVDKIKELFYSINQRTSKYRSEKQSH